MKRLFFLVFSILSIGLLPSISQDIQSNQILKKKIKDKQDLLRLQAKDLRTTSRIQKPVFRRFGRNIKDIVFDFDTKKFVYEKGLLDTLNNPPYEINELDGINIKIKNVNPFLYSVDLFELQGDQISNEKLLEAKQTNALSLKVDPLKQFEINFERNFQPVIDCDSTKYLTVIARRKLAQKKQLALADLLKKLKETNFRISSLDFAIRHKLDATNLSPLSDEQVKQSSLWLEQSKLLVKDQSQEVIEARKFIKDEKLDTIALDQTILVEKTTLQKRCTGRISKNLYDDLLKSIGRLTDNLNRVNEYIFVHNQLISTTRLSINNASELKDITEKLIGGLEIGDIRTLPQNYFQDHKKVLMEFNKIFSTLELLKTYDSANAFEYKSAISSAAAMLRDYKEFDSEKLVSQITGIYELVNQKNFELSYQTLSITENADFIKYRIEFKPVNNSQIQQTQGPYNLDMAFLINEGLKIDVSTGVILDFNLADPSYYFQKFTITQGGQSFDSVRVKKSPNTGNITPSVNLMLNAYKRSSLNFKPGISLGFGVSSDIRFRLYCGPSLIIGRKERIMVSSGIAFGAIVRNADGYDDGKTFANNSSVPNQVPLVQDSFKFGWYFGLGFNLSGKDTKGFVEKIKFK